MSFGEAIAPVVGRSMLASLFIISGVDKVQHWNAAVEALAAHGFKVAGPAVALAATVEIGGGIGLVLGFRTRLMALALFMFTLVVSFVMHDFWALVDPDVVRTQTQFFAKNMAIAGGLLMIVGLGAGRWSYDSYKGEK